MGSSLECGGDVGEASPEPALVEVVEVEVPVEVGGALVDGVDHDGAGSELPSSPNGSAEGVDEEVAADRRSPTACRIRPVGHPCPAAL